MVTSTRGRNGIALAVSGASDDAETAALGGPAVQQDASPTTTPTRLGRYVVVEEIGAGGMGRVLRAYDPKLRREVALKLLTARTQESEGVARIMREAQAMARLSHPNIVPIYDVELEGDASDTSSRAVIFISMEYVVGDTLRTWLAAVRRTPAEIVAAFVDAGHGLAAAHAAGVIHRDFKPTNAMVGADGRVRVMDFGLARNIMSVDTDDDFDPQAATSSAELTAAGTIMGTPPYMAPEQHAGTGVVMASDQYAFCVALYEALYGVRPFSGPDLATLVRHKLRGIPDPPTDPSRSVPRWLHAAVVRGLAVDPHARWSTMADLIAVLERGRARARARRALAGLAALGLASAAVAFAHRLDVRHRTAACEQAGASIDEVWNDDARAQLRAAMSATGVSYAASTGDKLLPWIDRHAAAWQQVRTESCLDHDVREIWDEQMLDRSLWCLDERRMELEALVGELVHADATVVQKAVASAAGLPSVEPCRDENMLERLPQPPVEGREEVRAVRAELSRAWALARAGKYDEGLALVRASRDAIDRLQWPPLSAAARAREATLLERVGAFEEAVQIGEEAYFEAARAHAWDVAAAAATAQVYVLGDRLARHADAFEWAKHAEVALGHAGDPAGLREAQRLGYLAGVHYRTGEFQAAMTLHERALAIEQEMLGADHPTLTSSLIGLSWVHYDTGDYATAGELQERALAIAESAFGPEHPFIAIDLNGCALVHYARGEYAQAREQYERAIEVWEAAFGPDYPDIASSLNNLGLVLSATGDPELALPLYERALAIQEKALGLDHPDVAASLGNLGNVYSGSGRHAEARPLHERALAIREKAFGPEHPDVAMSLNNLAIVHKGMGETASARALYERALAIKEKAQGPDFPGVASTLLGLADVHAATGDDEGAARMLERAVAIYDHHEGEQENELTARFALAKALVATGGDRARARALVEQARDGWRAAGGKAKELEEAEAWLSRAR